MQTKIEFEEEIWKDVSGFEGHYKISNYGRLLSVKNNKQFFMRLVIDKNQSYYRAKLRNGKNKNVDVRIHTLVAKAFVPNPENKRCVNHLDGIKINNVFSNLEWSTHAENNRHAFATGLINISGEKHYQSKLTNEIVFAIKYKFIGLKDSFLGKLYNVSRENIREIRKGRTWKHITKDFYKPISSISTCDGL